MTEPTLDERAAHVNKLLEAIMDKMDGPIIRPTEESVKMAERVCEELHNTYMDIFVAE